MPVTMLAFTITNGYTSIMAKKQSFTEQLRKAVLNCGMTRYAIFKATGIPQSQLSRFVHGGGGLSIESIDELCEFIGAELVLKQPRPKPSAKPE